MTAKTGLILAGGGARAAYQVGVLRAVAEILPSDTRQPFPIIVGTSAGAINALGLAGRTGSFRSRTRTLAAIWASLDSESVYRTDARGVLKNALRILWSMVRSRARQKQPLALLDNGPLGELLAEIVQFNRIEDAIARGELEGIGVTAMNYSNGRSTTFYQGQAHLQPWTRAQRRSIACQLTVNHLMASAALPTLFPAVKLGDHYFGDGALRQSRPLSPAIHLGADRLFIIGVSQQHGNFTPEPEAKSAPTIPNVLGQMLNAVFLDSVQTDLETLRRINALVTQMNSKQLTAAGMSDMRVIDTLTISPSRSLDELARDHIHELPRTMRWFLERTGSIKDAGSGGALSYVLFEQGYCQQLMQLGYEDAMAQADDVRRFFDMTPLNAAEAEAQATPEKHKMATTNGLTRRWLKLLGRA